MFRVSLNYFLVGSKKHLIHMPDFKQHYFEPLQNLDAKFQLHALQKVVNGKISLGEMKHEAKEFQLLNVAKALFVR